jgi:hypothetical protein
LHKAKVCSGKLVGSLVNWFGRGLHTLFVFRGSEFDAFAANVKGLSGRRFALVGAATNQRDSSTNAEARIGVPKEYPSLLGGIRSLALQHKRIPWALSLGESDNVGGSRLAETDGKLLLEYAKSGCGPYCV